VRTLFSARWRWQADAINVIYGRLVHAVEELADVGREGFHVSPLAFGVERVEGREDFRSRRAVTTVSLPSGMSRLSP